ncbi:MAG: hypothetical protein AABP62_31250 [Planctomycetota bacterium]
MRRTLLIIVLLACSKWSFSATRVRDYQRIRTAEWFQSYIAGVGSGLAWANHELALQGKPLLYCQPSGVEDPDYLKLLDDAVSRLDTTAAGDQRLESLMLSSLLSLYPCTSQPSQPREGVGSKQASLEIRPIKIDRAILAYATGAETPCPGALELSRHFSWDDPKGCWDGPALDVELNDVESIEYEDAGTAVNIILKVRTIRRRLFLSVYPLPGRKVFRHFRDHSPATMQHCFIVTGGSARTPVACGTWVTD